jgi:hypothetical protein
MPQPPAIPRLNALALAELRTATARYHQDGNAARWETSLQKTLARAHQAAYLMGSAERLGVRPDSPLLNPRNLSRVERGEIQAIVQTQVDFLARFVDIAPDLSEAAIDARTDLYALAPKQTYWTGWAGEDLDCVPGSCPDCYSRCRCSLSREDDGIHWECAEDDRSCDGCVERGNTWPLADQLVTSDESAE